MNSVMPEHDGLLREITANPDDIGPRLVYADWLSEQGDPRGEFVHLQCRAEQFDEESDDRAELECAAAELFEQNRKPWTEPLRRAGIRSYEFRRGFVESLTINAGKSIEALEWLFDAFPLRTLKFRNVKTNAQAERIAACRGLGSIRSLDFTGANLSAGRAKTVFASPAIRGLVELYASSNALGQTGARVIAAVEWQRLEVARLGSNKFNAKACRFLAHGLPHTLRTLDLSHSPIDDEAVEVLARSTPLRDLERIDLSAPLFAAYGMSDSVDPSVVTIESARSLCEATFAPSLKSLRVSGWRIGSEGQSLLRSRFSEIELVSTDGVDEFGTTVYSY